jgi:hypothetical protein
MSAVRVRYSPWVVCAGKINQNAATLHSSIAQSVERLTVNQNVPGSSPGGGVRVKETTVNVINDFLPEETFDYLCSQTINNRDFPWYLDTKLETSSVDPIYNFQYVHKFYDRDQPTSSFYDVIEEVFSQRLNVKAWIRCKLNLTLPTESHIEWGAHTDVPSDWESKTAIFFMSQTNGYTRIIDPNDDGTGIIRGNRNRILIFDGKYKHTGASNTDWKRRFVLNFNYF